MILFLGTGPPCITHLPFTVKAISILKQTAYTTQIIPGHFLVFLMSTSQYLWLLLNSARLLLFRRVFGRDGGGGHSGYLLGPWSGKVRNRTIFRRQADSGSHEQKQLPVIQLTRYITTALSGESVIWTKESQMRGCVWGKTLLKHLMRNLTGDSVQAGAPSLKNQTTLSAAGPSEHFFQLI